MKKVEIMLPDPIVEKLNRIASERKVTINDVVQVALTEFIENER